MIKPNGKLYLIPTPIGDNIDKELPLINKEILKKN